MVGSTFHLRGSIGCPHWEHHGSIAASILRGVKNHIRNLSSCCLDLGKGNQHLLFNLACLLALFAAKRSSKLQMLV